MREFEAVEVFCWCRKIWLFYTWHFLFPPGRNETTVRRGGRSLQLNMDLLYFIVGTILSLQNSSLRLGDDAELYLGYKELGVAGGGWHDLEDLQILCVVFFTFKFVIAILILRRCPKDSTNFLIHKYYIRILALSSPLLCKYCLNVSGFESQLIHYNYT